MEERTYIAADGAKIAYFITGQGEPLILVHGAGRSKEQWIDCGWVKELEKRYTVITPDLRGFGKSTVFHEEEYYEINRILDDLQGIMKECQVKEVRYLAHSYGATIGFQAIREGLPITKAVFASGSMGDNFFREICPQAHAEYEYLAKIKENGTYDQLTDYSEEDIAFIKEEDMKKFSTLFAAWSKWKAVSVDDLNCQVAIYAGTLDHNKEMIENTTVNKKMFLQHGIDTMCFEGLNHEELVTKPEICMPWVLEHLI